MALGPVRALAEDKAASGEELEDVLPGLEDFALKCVPAAHGITHALLTLGSHPDHDEFAGAVEPGDLDRVSAIVLAPLSSTGRNEREAITSQAWPHSVMAR